MRPRESDRTLSHLNKEPWEWEDNQSRDTAAGGQFQFSWTLTWFASCLCWSITRLTSLRLSPPIVFLCQEQWWTSGLFMGSCEVKNLHDVLLKTDFGNRRSIDECCEDVWSCLVSNSLLKCETSSCGAFRYLGLFLIYKDTFVCPCLSCWRDRDCLLHSLWWRGRNKQRRLVSFAVTHLLAPRGWNVLTASSARDGDGRSFCLIQTLMEAHFHCNLHLISNRHRTEKWRETGSCSWMKLGEDSWTVVLSSVLLLQRLCWDSLEPLSLGCSKHKNSLWVCRSAHLLT